MIIVSVKDGSTHQNRDFAGMMRGDSIISLTTF
jgi:hypothetical protein